MKNLFVYSALVFVTWACNSTAENHTGPDALSENQQASQADTVLICQATTDGVDDQFYVFSEQEQSMTDSITEVHIVPLISDAENLDSSTICDFMFGIVSTDFALYYDMFADFDGTISVFYDASRTRLVSRFQLVNRQPNGPVNVFLPDGERVISRVYKNGTCTASLLDLYAIDWTFNPSESALEIEKFSAYKKTDAAGNTTIELGESMHPNSGEFKNDLYELIQKPVFENPFTLNGQAFTGTILGYYPPNPLLPQLYFELPFNAGKLNDTVRLYNYWGELELEERFENGVLTETIYEMEYSETEGMAKPVIYLYPKSDALVNVKLSLKGKMTHSYPSYPAEGWNVKATQNGTLYDEGAKEYYALFWEGVSQTPFTYSEGFVVKGNETALFLENALDVIGLTRREANEFIMYWLPQMENNPYNLIHFSTAEYADMAELTVTPKPESLLRVMMVWSPLEKPVEIPQQNLYDLHVERMGFTVVEWGGKRQEFYQEF